MAKAKKNKTSASRLKELKGSYRTLREAMPVIGEAGTPPNGLGDLAERVQSATVLDDDAVGVVSASGSVYKGDMVTLTQELGKKGDTLRIANGEATMLGAVSLGGTVVIVFVQDDDTYIKTAAQNGTDWTLGPTKTFVEGPLDKVTLIPYQTSPLASSAGTWYLAAFYMEDDVGMAQFWALESDGLTHYGTDIWLDEPMTNICGAWTPRKTINTSGFSGGYTNALTLAGLDQNGKIAVVEIAPQWQWNEATEKSYLTAYIRSTKTIEPGDYTGMDFKETKLADFSVPEPDKEIYDSAAWNLVCNPLMGSMLLLFPGADGKRYVLELWLVGWDYSQTPTASYIYEPAGCQPMMMEGQLPCGAGIGSLGGPSRIESNAPILVAGLARLSGPNMKSAVGVEQWYSGYGHRLLPLWFGEENQSYGKNVGLLSVCSSAPEKAAVAVGYCVEGKYRAFLLYVHHKGLELVGGPSVELADVDTAGVLVESGDGAALIWEKSHSIYLQQFVPKDVVISTGKGSVSDGVAVTGGRGGQEIQIRLI